MSRTVEVLSDYEDWDEDWKANPDSVQSGPKSTLTGKTVLREVRRGHTVDVSFDDGFYDPTKLYLAAMAEEYNLLICKLNDRHWMIGPEPEVFVSAEPDEIEEPLTKFSKQKKNGKNAVSDPTVRRPAILHSAK